MYKQDYEESADENLNKYNDAQLQTLRLHELQVYINKAHRHFLDFFEDEGLYGYEIKFSSIIQFFVEISPRCNTEEKKKIFRMIKNIDEFLEKYPIFKERLNEITHQSQIQIDKNSAKVIRDFLIRFDMVVKKLAKKHGYSSPDLDESGLF